MNSEIAKKIDVKRMFIGHCEDALISDPKLSVLSVEYKAQLPEDSERIDEFVTVNFLGGSHKTVCISGDSTTAIMIALARAAR